MKLSMPKAADQFIAAKRAVAAAEALKADAERTLKEWFHDHPKEREYKGRIGFAVISRTQLDTEKVKSHLGKKLPDFQKVVQFEQLSILQP